MSVVVMAALLAGCGGGGSSSAGGTGTVVQPGTGSTPTPTSSGCTLRARQDWVLATMREWYLFPETLPAALDPSGYTNVDDYLDALTATARSQGRDRYFTYLTSISQENAYYNSGSSAGFGFRLATDGGTGVVVTESFEGTPALQAGIDRGTRILAIGTSTSDLQDVNGIVAAKGLSGVTDALGPSTAGTSRTLRVQDYAGNVSTVTITKADYSLQPVSSRYGALVLTDPSNGERIGYVNLRTFINTADPALRSAFATFKAQGVTKVIVDLRYNGGGLVAISKLFGDLLGGGRGPSDVFDYMTFRPEKASNNSVDTFSLQPQSITPVRLAFIGTKGTASASEMLINAMTPYYHANSALIGTNTYGKPVGQIAVDQTACDDRLRVIAFSVQNANRQGAYFSGLANTVEASCSATDDTSKPLGDVREASVKAALDFLAGRSCAPITGSAGIGVASISGRELLSPARPTTAQREVPGLF